MPKGRTKERRLWPKPTSKAGFSCRGKEKGRPPPATTHSHDKKTTSRAKHSSRYICIYSPQIKISHTSTKTFWKLIITLG